jgi:hypothetical protein
MEEINENDQRGMKDILDIVAKAREYTDSLAPRERVLSDFASRVRVERAEELSGLFSRVKENPCATCLDTCCTVSNGAGYHVVPGALYSSSKLTLHPDLIEDEELLASFVIPHDPEDFPIISKLRHSKCAFLKPGHGCNLPAKYRSDTCLKHTCNKMDTVLKHEGLTSEFKDLKQNFDNVGSLLEKIGVVRRDRNHLERDAQRLANKEAELDDLYNEVMDQLDEDGNPVSVPMSLRINLNVPSITKTDTPAFLEAGMEDHEDEN